MAMLVMVAVVAAVAMKTSTLASMPRWTPTRIMIRDDDEDEDDDDGRSTPHFHAGTDEDEATAASDQLTRSDRAMETKMKSHSELASYAVRKYGIVAFCCKSVEKRRCRRERTQADKTDQRARRAREDDLQQVV